MSSGAEFLPLSQWNLGNFFPSLKKKNPNLKKKRKRFFFFLEYSNSRIFIQSPHTHKLHWDNLLSLHLIFFQFNCNSMCNSYFVFKLTENAVIVCLEISNLVVYRANFPNLKGPRAPSQNCQKIPESGLPICAVGSATMLSTT